jgi:hypothetical protein
MSDLDRYTLNQLRDTADQLFAEHGRLWRRCMNLSVLHPDYPITSAAMHEVSALLTTIHTAIKTRTDHITHA